MSEAASRTFDGYRRADGRVGVRNHVLVLSPTGLTSAAAARVSSLVRGTICVTSGYGRGQVAADAKLQFDTLTGLACHPNVAATRGAFRRSRYHEGVRRCDRRDRASRWSAIRCRTCAKTRWRSSMPACARRRGWFATRRGCAGKPCALGELCVAVECGHSDATSGLVCNPLAGRMTEIVVAAGGRAMFSETVEWTGRRASAREARDQRRGRRPDRACRQRSRAHGARLGRRYSRGQSRAAEQGGRIDDDRGEGARARLPRADDSVSTACCSPAQRPPGAGTVS